MQVTTRVKTGTARAFPSTLTSSQITFSQPSTSSGHAAHHDVRSSALPRHSSHNHHQPCPSCSASWSEQQQQLQQRLLLSRKRSIPCRSINEVVSGIAGVDPGLLQDILVGGAVVGSVGSALYLGLKKESEPCSLCQGTGGIKCFACDGDGKNTKSRDELYDEPNKRDPFGRSVNPRECRVCRGAGLVLCSQCKGSGYQ